MPLSPQHSTLKRLAAGIGLQGIGVCPALPVDEANRLRLAEWLGKGYHAGMGYMARHVDKRLNPTALMPGAKSILSVIASYNPGSPAICCTPPKISRYALSIDYHSTLRGMLYQLLQALRQAFGPMQGRAFVDSAPVMERYWAARAGLGWIGKNGLLISPTLGSYVFIGQLMVDWAFEPLQEQQPSRCGECTRCMDACPTGAIVAPGRIDSSRCIAYLTVERPAQGQLAQPEGLHGWCFGCDACQEVCPWNANPSATASGLLMPLPRVAALRPADMVGLTPESFRALFASTPVARAGFERVQAHARLAAPKA